MRKFILLISISIFSLPIISQTITGVIINNQTKQAIPYANIGLMGTSTGTVSNANGAFKLNNPTNNKTNKIYFSCIGYKSLEYQLKSNETELTISLIPQTYDINEITIMPDSTLRSFLLKAYKKIPDNYLDAPSIHKGFYRASIINEQGEYLRFMELLTEGYKSSYENKQEGTIKVLKSRKFINDSSFIEFPVLFYGGVYFIHSADYVKNRNLFLKGDKSYNYKLIGNEKIDNHKVHIIQFEPANINSSKYKGKLYIDASTYAYLKIDIEYSEKQLGERFNFIHRQNLKSIEKTVTSNYIKHGERYYLNAVYEDEKIKTSNDKVISCPLEYIVTSISTNDAQKIPYDSITPLTYIPATEAEDFASSDWKYFNTVPLNTYSKVDTTQAAQLFNNSHNSVSENHMLQFLRIYRKLSFEYNVRANSTSVHQNYYSLNYNNLDWEKQHEGTEITYNYHGGLSYFINPLNTISYSYSEALSRKYFNNSTNLSYHRLLPLKTMGRKIIANLNAGWEWQKSGFSLGTASSDMDFSFGGKKFKQEKIQVYSGLKMNGLNLGAGIDFQFSNLLYLTLSTNYMTPLKTDDIITLQERSGFFLFRKQAHEKILNTNIEYQINGVPSQKSGMKFNNWSFGVGIKMKI